MNVGQRIREAREDLGMQQTVLARRIGVAPNTIGRYESGERVPPVAMLERIARELRTEPAEFLREPALLGKDRAPETGQDVWRAIAKEALGADTVEVLIPTTPLTPELFPSVLEILEQEAHQLENLFVVIEGGYIKAGLKVSE